MTKDKAKNKLLSLKIPEPYIDSFFKVYGNEYPEFQIPDINITIGHYKFIEKKLLSKTKLLRRLLKRGFYAFQYFTLSYEKIGIRIDKNKDFLILDDFFGITNNLIPNELNYNWQKLSIDCKQIIDKIESFLLKDKIKYNIINMLEKVWPYNRSATLEFLMNDKSIRVRMIAILNLLQKYNSSGTHALSKAFNVETKFINKKGEYQYNFDIFFSKLPISELKLLGLSDYDINNKSIVFNKPSGITIERNVIRKLNANGWRAIPANRFLTDDNVDIIATPNLNNQKLWITISLKTNRQILSHQRILERISKNSIYFNNNDGTEEKISPIFNYLFKSNYYEINIGSKKKSAILYKSSQIINIPNGEFIFANLSIYNAYNSLKNNQKYIKSKSIVKFNDFIEDRRKKVSIADENNKKFNEFISYLNRKLSRSEELMTKLWFNFHNNTIEPSEEKESFSEIEKDRIIDSNKKILSKCFNLLTSLDHFLKNFSYQADSYQRPNRTSFVLMSDESRKRLASIGQQYMRLGFDRFILNDAKKYMDMGLLQTKINEVTNKAVSIRSNLNDLTEAIAPLITIDGIESKEISTNKESIINDLLRKNSQYEKENKQLKELAINLRSKLNAKEGRQGRFIDTLHDLKKAEFGQLAGLKDKLSEEEIENYIFELKQKSLNDKNAKKTLEFFESFLEMFPILPTLNEYEKHSNNLWNYGRDSVRQSRTGLIILNTDTNIESLIYEHINEMKERINSNFKIEEKTSTMIKHFFSNLKKENKKQFNKISFIRKKNYMKKLSSFMPESNNDFKRNLLDPLFFNSLTSQKSIKSIDKLEIEIEIKLINREALEFNGFLNKVDHKQSNNFIHIKYQDNGIGLNKQDIVNIEKKKQGGTFNIKETCKKFGGYVEFKESKKGFACDIIIPQISEPLDYDYKGDK